MDCVEPWHQLSRGPDLDTLNDSFHREPRLLLTNNVTLREMREMRPSVVLPKTAASSQSHRGEECVLPLPTLLSV